VLSYYDRYKFKYRDLIWRPHLDAKLFKNSNPSISRKTSNKIGFEASFNQLLSDLKKGMYRSKIDENVLLKRYKNFNVFKLVQSKLDILQLFKKVDLEGYKTHYQIDKTNRIIGFMPDYIGTVPSRVVRAKNYIAEFIADNLNDIKDVVSSSCYDELIDSINSPRVVYSGGFETCGAHLREYFKNNTTEEIYDRDTILRIVGLSNFKWFAAPVCEFYNVKEIVENLVINLNAFSGHYTSRIFGNKKGDSDVVSRSVAMRLWERLHDKPYKNTYLWSILGREKDIKINFKNTDIREVGTRVIMTCEAPITYLLMWFSQKFNFILGYSNWNNTYNVCGEFNNDKFVKLHQKKYEYDFELEADWSYYDSNIDTNFLEIGAAILCCGLPTDKLHLNIMYTFISSVVTKYVILPPGAVVELNRAQPSGHPAGTLVNCNVNLIYWCIIGYMIYGDDYADNMHVEVYGDDTRAYFKYHKNLIYIDEYIKKAGLKSEPVLPNMRSTKLSTSSNFSIDYLKRRFNEDGISWNHKKMFDKFLYQSKNRNLNDQIGVVLSFLESVPTDSDLREFSKLFVRWINNKYIARLDRTAKRRILAFESVLNGDAGFNMRFDYQLGDRVYDRSYEREVKLLSFSTFRPSLAVETDRLLMNMNANKYVLLIVLGIAPNVLGLIDFDELKGGSRPPPINAFINSTEVSECESFYKDEVNNYINKIRELAYS